MSQTQTCPHAHCKFVKNSRKMRPWPQGWIRLPSHALFHPAFLKRWPIAFWKDKQLDAHTHTHRIPLLGIHDLSFCHRAAQTYNLASTLNQNCWKKCVEHWCVLSIAAPPAEKNAPFGVLPGMTHDMWSTPRSNKSTYAISILVNLKDVNNQAHLHCKNDGLIIHKDIKMRTWRILLAAHAKSYNPTMFEYIEATFHIWSHACPYILRRYTIEK